jgi:hypothetical protein
MPAHHLDTRGTCKYQKKRLWHTPDGRCATCPAKLTSTDRKDGCRRCKACRASNPGRPTPTTAIVKPRASQPPPKQSWWMLARPDGFTQLAGSRSFSGHRLTLPLNHKGMFGE